MLASLPNRDLLPQWTDALEGFELDLRARGHAAGTVSSRRSIVRVMARRASAAGLSPGEISRSWLKRYLLREQGARRGNGYVSVYQGLRLFWAWHAAEEGGESPIEGIPVPRAVETVTAVLTQEQIRAVLGACSGRTPAAIRNRAIILVLLDTGLRCFELCQLSTGDVDLKAQTIFVRRGKGGKARWVVFGTETAQALWRLLKTRPDDGPLFASLSGGGRLTTSGLSKLLCRLGRDAGVRGLRPHLFRHAWAHYGLADGIQEHDLMKLAGWNSTSMLSRYGAALAGQRAIQAGRLHSVVGLVHSR